MHYNATLLIHEAHFPTMHWFLSHQEEGAAMWSCGSLALFIEHHETPESHTETQQAHRGTHTQTLTRIPSPARWCISPDSKEGAAWCTSGPLCLTSCPHWAFSMPSRHGQLADPLSNVPLLSGWGAHTPSPQVSQCSLPSCLCLESCSVGTNTVTRVCVCVHSPSAFQ